MKSEQIEQFLNSCKEASLVVIGDMILDHYLWGEVGRISPEAPVVVVDVLRETHGAGGAANVANNLAALGAKVKMAGVVGDDAYGEQLIGLLAGEKIDTSGIVAVAQRRTSVKSRVVARSQQVVRVDRESRELVPVAQRQKMLDGLKRALTEAQAVILSDYGKGVIGPELFALFQQIPADKRPLLIVDPKEANFNLYREVTVVTPNRLEAEQASGVKISTPEEAIKAARKLIERWSAQIILVTLGEQGMVLVSRDASQPPLIIPTQAREVFDVSGAGDTVVAVFSLALALNFSMAEAAHLANMAAGIVVAEVGAVPVRPEQIRELAKRG